MHRILLAALAVLFCLLPQITAAGFLPLQNGNVWTYRDAVSGQQFTVRVGTPYFINEKVYYTLINYATNRLLVRENDQQELVYLDQDSGSEFVLTSFAPLDLAWWQAPYRQCDQEGQAMKRRQTHDGPAGPWFDALEIRYRTYSCRDAGIESEQFVENVGMVRRVVQTIAGPRTFDLVAAQLGSLEINALPTGKFSVLVTPRSMPGQYTATLRINTNNGQQIALPFATSQDYDLELYDAAGRVLWRWSDGRVFTTATRTLRIISFWEAKVDFELPAGVIPSVENPLSLSAWVSTTPPTRFAATQTLAPAKP